jgi:hypothetical protein
LDTHSSASQECEAGESQFLKPAKMSMFDSANPLSMREEPLENA